MSEHDFDDDLTASRADSTDADSNAGWTSHAPVRFAESAPSAENHLSDPPAVPASVPLVEPEPPISSDDFPDAVREEPVTSYESDAPADEPEMAPPMDSPVAPPIASRAVSELNYRIEQLTFSIEQYPTVPVNYVLRGEACLERHDFDSAAADFRTAIALAETHDESLDWGYINAAYIDRAEDGLRRMNR